MSVSKLSRRALGAVAATSLLVGVLPVVAASAATPEPRDITKFACPSNEVPDPGFTDDDETTAEHRASIACIVWYELASGRTASTYAPSQAVNRGQMASFIGNLLVKGGVELSENPPDAFSDDDNTQHEKRINQLAELGVVEGDRDGKYNAHLPVTRAQMASFLNRAYAEITGTALTSSEDYFTDDEGAFHEDNINAVAGAGIAAGRTSTTYAPSQSVRRDQMATFLARETDLLVEEGKIDKPVVKPADVKITATSVEQGGKLTGTIVTQEGVKVTSAKVSGCGFTNQALTLTGTTNSFELTIPLTQPVGQCKLTFTISRESGDDVTDEETITVTAVESQTDAPELVSVSSAAQSDGTYKVTYSFDETLNSAAGAEKNSFKLYTAAAEAKFPDTLSLSGATVVATFSKADFESATTAAVAYSAVEDAQNLPNPEGAFPLAERSTAAGATQAPDLIAVEAVSTPGATVYAFTFDQDAFDVGTAANYHLVFDNGDVATGDRFTGASTRPSKTRNIEFDDPVAGKTLVRAYVDEGTVSDTEQDTNPVTPAQGKTNPLQAVHKPGTVKDRPNLQSVSIDAANNTVTYTFDRGVSVVEDTNPVSSGNQTTRFKAYRADGTQVSSSTASSSSSNRNVVIATFTGDPDPIPVSTVGASVVDDAVKSNVGGLTNRPDEMSAEQQFKAGRTAAPDLLSVARSTSGSNSVLTYTFDQPVSQTGAESSTGGQRFTIYQQDGTRTEMTFNNTPSANNTCSADGEKVVCSAASTSDTGKAIDSATLAGVEAGTVDDPSNPAYKNYEASAPLK